MAALSSKTMARLEVVPWSSARISFLSLMQA